MENTVTSFDKTKISYYSYGQGPSVVIVPGNNRMAHNYQKLVSFLMSDFTVHVIERRGRGQSGPQGQNYSIDDEVDDLGVVREATKAKFVFGHSYGGLIALHASLNNRAISKLVAYEPGVSIEGSFNGKWLPEFTELVENNRQVQAMALFLKETKLSPISELPSPLLKAFCLLLLSGKSGKEMRSMMGTTPKEIEAIIELDSDGHRYKQVSPSTLLLGGSKSPKYLTDIFKTLYAYIPKSKYKILYGLDHNAPDLNAPQLIANELKLFFK